MLEFDLLQSGLLLLLLLVLGEWLSRRTRAVIPAILFSGLLFLAGMWSGVLPEDLIARTGFSELTPILIMLVLVNMGTMTSLRELFENRRVVALAALSFLAQLMLLFAVFTPLFGLNLAVASLPGGSTVSAIVQERALALGYDSLALLSVLVLSTRALVACPLTTFLLKREVLREKAFLLQAQEEASACSEAAVAAGAGQLEKESYYPPLLRLYAAAWLSSRLELVTGISVYVLCLFVGILLTEAGFFRRNEMSRSQSEGLVFLAIMSMVLSGFAAATPAMLAQMLPMLVGVLAFTMLSILLASVSLGRLFGFTPGMSVCLGMNIMIGFPMNLMISQDVIDYLVPERELREELLSRIGNKMVIAGFTSVTFLATVAAGLLVGLMN